MSTFGRMRSAAVLASVFACSLWPLQAPGQDRPRLFVYLHTTMTASALEKSLSEELTGADVTVFGRFADFERAIEKDPPDAVLALQPVLTDSKLDANLLGMRGGKSAEKYVVMSLDRPFDRGDLSTKTIGAVELLGRKRLSEFISGLLRLESAARIKPVTKEADLLPLLQFKVADVIVLPERLAREFQRSSNLRLVVADAESIEVGLPAVAFLSEAGRRTIRPLIARASSKMNQQIGVEAWK